MPEISHTDGTVVIIVFGDDPCTGFTDLDFRQEIKLR
jgi:hypothetical protein